MYSNLKGGNWNKALVPYTVLRFRAWLSQPYPDTPPETLRAYTQIATRRGGGIHTGAYCSCGVTNGSTCADQTQMVTEPWASGLCVLVFWCRDAGPRLAENETRHEKMECNLDEDTSAVE